MGKPEETNSRPIPVIEPLKRGDVRKISCELAGMDPWRSLGYRPLDFAHYLLHSDCALSRYAISVSGNLSGVLAIRFPWLFGPFIELIALFDGSRGKGIGRRVIDWIRDRYPAERNIWVSVSSSNLDAQKFYDRLGFTWVAALEDLVKPGSSEILLRKRT
jgi:ribosomal protein S18 acetylase RimI-like enzyme